MLCACRMGGCRFAADRIYRLRTEAVDVPGSQGRWAGDHRRGRRQLRHFQKSSDESCASTRSGRLCRYRTWPRGGLRLAKPVAEINLGAVVRYTEPDMAIVACLNPVEAPCAIKSCCVLRRALAKAGDAFIAVLDGYTLADLARPRLPLRRLLAINPPRLARSSIGRATRSTA